MNKTSIVFLVISIIATIFFSIGFNQEEFSRSGIFILATIYGFLEGALFSKSLNRVGER
jgi:hypothetical protein